MQPTTEDTVFVKVLDHGFVELLDFMGDDRRCVAAARVSLRRESLSLADMTEEQIAKDQGLLNRLMRDKHTSPFEHAVFQFRIRAPIFVVRQWMRHRFSSYNEESGRYVKLVDEFYLPDRLRIRVGKAMDYSFEPIDDERNAYFRKRIGELYEEARALYEEMLEAGIAREHARIVLPVAQYTTFFWTVNALSLMNFLNLRNSEHAQYEIRQYARAIEDIFAQKMPWTQAAFRKHWGPSAIH
ncbi:MAG: FAD-dependent thymidylate synthase [Chloroflexi bacterium]|nr:MAG: FAD-dependent thymidylate synthase [Chloroflexota bacterium]